MRYHLMFQGTIGLLAFLYIKQRKDRESLLSSQFALVEDRSQFFHNIHDSIAENYHKEWKEYEKSKSTEIFRKKLISHYEGLALEVGIGTGMNFGHYSKYTYLIGIDWSTNMLDKCLENVKGNTKVQHMDAKKMGFKDDLFDFVVATFVLSSSDEPDQIMKEMKRVCKKGGNILILDRGKTDDDIIGLWLELFRFENLFKYGYDQCMDIKKIVNESGLDIEVEIIEQVGSLYYYVLTKP